MNEEQITVSEEEIEQMISLSENEDQEQQVAVTEEPTVVSTAKSYNKLKDKPQINDIELIGNKTFEDLGADSLTNLEIEAIINSVV